MAGVNKVILVGNLGQDPKAKTFQNGGEIVNISIATSETWKDRNTGERKERTEWHNVSIQNEGLCKVAMRYLRKGSKVYIEGQLRTRKWTDQTGNDRWSTDVVIAPFNGSLVMLDAQRQGEGGSSGSSGNGGSSDSWGGHQGGFGSDLDDDVPF